MKSFLVLLLLLTGCASVPEDTSELHITVFYDVTNKRVMGTRCEGYRPCMVKMEYYK